MKLITNEIDYIVIENCNWERNKEQNKSRIHKLKWLEYDGMLIGIERESGDVKYLRSNEQ